VVGHHREVEGTAQLGAAQRPPLLVEGLQAHRLAPGKAVGISGCVAHAQRVGVEGESRVDVGVAEEGLAQRVAVRARFAALVALEASGGRRREHEQESAGGQDCAGGQEYTSGHECATKRVDHW